VFSSATNLKNFTLKHFFGKIKLVLIICSLFLIARTIEDLIEVLFLEGNNEEMLKPRQRLERRISQGNSYPLPMLVTEILALKIW